MESSVRHTCLKLQIDDALIFVKGTWLPSRFDLSITDGIDAWICSGNLFLLSLSLISFSLWVHFLLFRTLNSNGKGSSAESRTLGPTRFGVHFPGREISEFRATGLHLQIRRFWDWREKSKKPVSLSRIKTRSRIFIYFVGQSALDDTDCIFQL